METQNQGQGHMSFSLHDIDQDALAHARDLVDSYPRNEGEGGGEGGASGGTVQASEGTQSAGEGGGEPAPTGEPGGQGFYQEYVEGVPEEHRPVVQDVLEKYRQEQDANFNRRFESLKQETEIPVTLYNALMSDPVSTMQWIAERFNEEQGRDLRSELLETWQDGQPQSGQGGDPQPGQEGEPQYLTPEQLEEWYENRRQEEQRQAQQQQKQQQTVEQRERTVNSWIDEAAESFGLELQDADGQEDPLRAAIVMQANELHESGKARGKAAIEMVVEQFSKRFGQSPASGEGNQGKRDQPVTANGGSPPPSKDIDVTDKDQRRGRMMELFPGQ